MEIKIDKQIFVSVSVSGVINFFYPLFSYLVFTDWVCLRVEAQCRITFKKFQVVAVVAAEISDGTAIAASLPTCPTFSFVLFLFPFLALLLRFITLIFLGFSRSWSSSISRNRRICSESSISGYKFFRKKIARIFNGLESQNACQEFGPPTILISGQRYGLIMPYILPSTPGMESWW